MTETDIARIEATLAVALPVSYRAYLAEDDQTIEDHGPIDDVTALRDADQIIEATLDYRRGFEGRLPGLRSGFTWAMKPMPAPMLWIARRADSSTRIRGISIGHLWRTTPLLKAFCKSKNKSKKNSSCAHLLKKLGVNDYLSICLLRLACSASLSFCR